MWAIHGGRVAKVSARSSITPERRQCACCLESCKPPAAVRAAVGAIHGSCVARVAACAWSAPQGRSRGHRAEERSRGHRAEERSDSARSLREDEADAGQRAAASSSAQLRHWARVAVALQVLQYGTEKFSATCASTLSATHSSNWRLIMKLAEIALWGRQRRPPRGRQR